MKIVLILILACLISALSTWWYKVNLKAMSNKRLGFFRDRGPLFLLIICSTPFFLGFDYEFDTNPTTAYAYLAGGLMLVATPFIHNYINGNHDHWS